MKNILNAGVAFLSLGLMGCQNLYEPPNIVENRIQVREESVFEDVALYDVNDVYLAALARHYQKHGGTPMDVIVTYDPRSYKSTAMKAMNEVSGISATLRENGVSNINPSVLPVKGQGDDAHLLISYDAYSAHAPKGCEDAMDGVVSGVYGEYDDTYKIGCASKSLMARQISKPSDLLGRGAVDPNTDGRYSANIVDAYRSGAQNKSLEGESASGE